MVQDDKVSAVALSHGLVASSIRTHEVPRAGGAERDGQLGGVVGSASAMESEAPQGTAHGTSEETPVVGGEAAAAKPAEEKTPLKANNVRKIRIERMMSKAELARRA